MLTNLTLRAMLPLFIAFVTVFGGCATTEVVTASATTRPLDEGWCRLGGGMGHRSMAMACMPTLADRAIQGVFDAHQRGMQRAQELAASGAATGEVRAQLEETGRTLDRFHQAVRDACAISAWECRTACEHLPEMRNLTRRYNTFSSGYLEEGRWFRVTEDSDVPLMCAAEAARRAQR